MPVAGVGGTKIQAVVLDDDGEVLADAKVPTPTGDLPTAIASLVRRLGVGVSAVGIGVPGVIDRRRGTVIAAPNLSIASAIPLAALVGDALGVERVVLDNDVNAATVAEHRAGAAAASDDAMCVFLGTGVGAGLVLGGALRRGERGLAGEIGHVVVRDGGRPCACGGRGHLEAYAGRRSLEAQPEWRDDTGRDALLADAADALGAAVATTVALVDIDLVVVGGGFAVRLGEPFLAEVDAALRRHLFVPSLPVAVVPAALGALGGAIGAALLATFS